MFDLLSLRLLCQNGCFVAYPYFVFGSCSCFCYLLVVKTLWALLSLFFFFFCLAFSWVGWTVGGPCRKDLVLPMVRRHFSVGRKLGFFSLCI